MFHVRKQNILISQMKYKLITLLWNFYMRLTVGLQLDWLSFSRFTPYKNIFFLPGQIQSGQTGNQIQIWRKFFGLTLIA